MTPRPCLPRGDGGAEALAPLIVTLTLDATAQAFFEAQRRRYFPPERLQVGAHVTLFHALPGEHEPAIAATLAELCTRTPELRLQVTGLRSLGRGVAYVLAGTEAVALRAGLCALWSAWLTPQDRAAWAPHVTVQNKVMPEVAQATLAALRSKAWPGEVLATALALWRYRGGPWEAVAAHEFGHSSRAKGL